MAEESAVKVCVRVRPIVAREELTALENTEPQLFWKADKKSIHQVDDGSSNKSFSFDRVFTAEETTSQLYQAVGNPLVVSTVGGYNGTVFAYGQTSSGKTFTMMGSDHNPGVIPMAVEDVFKTIKSFPNKEFLLRVSYMEIYNETVTDLLVDSWKRKPLEVRETINKNIYVADLTEELVTSTSQVLAWIRKGEKSRQYAKTKMNQRSSRSHAIFRMIIESRERGDPASGDNTDGAIIVSHLNLVDLAGSERASQTGAEGARFKEGCNINRSLFTLGQVIKKLTDENQNGFTNYRDSKLTRILQNSLGGNAKTVIICAITPFTLEETLSTLQFASTAKKMKNDPHVTEVSDDGALLKRYRNEIVDLKRRLQEVTSVTHTTVTEKEVLSQLLQEKDQLQREQEYRIRNLTQLLVTSANLAPAQKMRKRRVTWAGKLSRLSHQPASDDDGMSDLTFGEPFSRKGKAHNSCLTDIGEGDEFSDSHWEIPEEPSDEMDTSENFVTFRRFGNSSTDFESPEPINQFSKEVTDLKLQLEAEVQQKEEANKKAETLEGKVAELQLQLQVEAQQRTDSIERMMAAEKTVADLERHLQTEAQQKEDAMEKTVTADKKAADLERQLSQTEQSLAESKWMTMEMAEIIQMCETLASEKDKVTAERDYLNQELGSFEEQTQKWKQEIASLSQELKERKELNEFECLEANFYEERENELQNELSCLKTAVKSSEDQCLKLQNKLQTLSEELKKKTEFADELQQMSGKDLVQEVAKLRRSLDDAEGVSRDTKKEWAFLRSENIALEELKVSLTARQEKMEAEMNRLLSQLETEKSRYKKMETDLQKELNIVFDENSKLTTLLDGKVPQNLIDSVELGRTVARLEKELAASCEAEKALTAELDKLASFQTLPVQVENLTKQVCDLTEELQNVQNQKDDLRSGRAQCEQDAQQLRDVLQTLKEEMQRIQADFDVSAQKESELRHQCEDVTQQLHSLHSELERSEVERSQLVAFLEERDMKLKQLHEALECVQTEKEALLSEQRDAEEIKKLLSTISSLRAEGDELRTNLQTHVDQATETNVLLQHLQQELQEQKQKNSDLMKISEQKESELEEDIQRLSQELQAVQDQKAALQTSSSESSAEQVETQLSTAASLAAERNQLKVDLQENVEMVRTLTEEFENLRAERDALMSEKEASSQTNTEEMEELQHKVTSLREERDQLQEDLEALREQEKRLRAELEEQIFQQQLTSKPQPLTDEQESYRLQTEQLEEKLKKAKEEISQLKSDLEENFKLLQELQAVQDEKVPLQTSSAGSSAQEVERLLSVVDSLTAERDQLKVDLQENVEMMIEHQDELRTALERNREQKKTIKLMESENERRLNEHPNVLSSQLEELQENMRTLNGELENLRAERDALLSEKEASSQTNTKEMEELQHRVTSLMEERDQLQEALEALREQEKQLRAELDDRIQKLAQTQIERAVMVTRELQAEDGTLTQLQQELAEAKCCLQSLRDEFQTKLDLLNLYEQKEADFKQQIMTLTEEHSNTLAERDALILEKKENGPSQTEQLEKLRCRVMSLSEQRDQLQETLDRQREEKKQLREELEDRMQMMQCEFQQQLISKPQPLMDEEAAYPLQIEQLQEMLEKAKEEISQLKFDLQENVKLMTEKQEELNSSHEKSRVFQEELAALESRLAELENIQSSRNEQERCIQSLKSKIQILTEELESVRADGASLLSEKETSSQAHTEEMETLQRRVASLREDRDQLQEALGGLSEQEKQLRAELEDRRQMISATQEKLNQQEQWNMQLQTEREEQEATLQHEIGDLVQKLKCAESERDALMSEKEASSQAHTKEMETLQRRVLSLNEERDQLQEALEARREQEKQLRAELEDRRRMISATQEKLNQQEQWNLQLQTEREEQEATLQHEIGDLVQKLKCAEAERDALMSEKEASSQAHTEEMETLQRRVLSLNEERDQLQEALEARREQEKQLRAELEDRREKISATQEKLNQQEQWNVQLQTEREEQEATLQHEVQQLKEQLQIKMEQKTEANASLQLLNESKLTISTLKQELNTSDQHTKQGEESVSSQLQDSASQLQESFETLQDFIDTYSGSSALHLHNLLITHSYLKPSLVKTLPKATVKVHSAVYELGLKTVQNFLTIQEELHLQALCCRKMFKELVNKDLAIFEERRLQDLLVSRAHAPTYSVNDIDFHSLWEQRFSKLLEKRQLYVQKMDSISDKFWDIKASCCLKENAEICEREKVKDQIERAIHSQPFSLSVLDSILSKELDRRSTTAQTSTTSRQLVVNEYNRVLDELKQLDVQSETQLREERSKNATLLQALEGASLKTEVSLLEDNHKLVLQLHQAEGNIKILHAQIEELEEARTTANNRVSQHKQATQLLQTELQDTRAIVQEKDDSITTLKSKLRESEKKESPSAVELENLHNKLFQTELKLSSITDEHQQEIQRMKFMLNEKEDSLRKTKEALRKLQQQGEESFLQGKDLYDKLTNPRGVVIESSIGLEKTKLEEKVRQLQLKITELESLMSSQQADISKWKNRAIKLKGKSKAEGDKMASPSTPTKRGFSTMADSDTVLHAPKKFLLPANKLLDSPKRDLATLRKASDSPKFLVPKSSFFDTSEGSELLSRSRPKQFFDNSALGNIPDAAVGIDKKEGESYSVEFDINQCQNQCSQQ